MESQDTHSIKQLTNSENKSAEMDGGVSAPISSDLVCDSKAPPSTAVNISSENNQDPSKMTIEELIKYEQKIQSEILSSQDFAQQLAELESMTEYFRKVSTGEINPSKVAEEEEQRTKDEIDIELGTFNHERWINTIQCMDCIKGMKNLPDDSIDIAITSPPYNMSVRVGEGNLYDEYSDDLSMSEYTEFLFKVIDEMLRVTRYYVFFNIQMLGSNKESVLKVISKYQDNIKEICIWAKTASPPASSERCLSNQYEFILCLSKYDRKGKQFVRAFFDNRSGGQENIANCLIRNMQKDNKCPEHKATFPEWLPEFFIKLFSKEGDLVLDPFMGTGTTAYVAKQMQRRFIGFDLSEHYCNFARNRLNQLNIFGFSNPQNKQPSFAVNQKRLDF